MRCQDVIVVAGLCMVLLGTLLMFPAWADRMSWKFMLGGFALWLVGFVAVIAWLLWRWSAAQPEHVINTDSKEQVFQPERAITVEPPSRQAIRRT